MNRELKPSWDDVLEGYDWMAQDEPGSWYAYKKEPHLKLKQGYRRWTSEVRDLWKAIEISNIPNPNWKDTLEKMPGKVYEHTMTLPFSGLTMTWNDVEIPLIFGNPYLKALVKTLKGNDMNACPITRNLEPKERINAKRTRLEGEIAELDKRIKGLDDIIASVNWNRSTDEIQNKAVEAADRI